jgi:membrane protein YdbS with pleckstrin-like domain
MFPAAVYIEHIAQLNDQLLSLKKRKNNLAWARLLILVAGVAITWYFLNYSAYVLAITLAVALLSIYIRLVILYVNNRLKMENLERLVQINKHEIDIDAGHYTQLPDGKE